MRYDMAERLARLACAVIYGNHLGLVIRPSEDSTTDKTYGSAFTSIRNSFLAYGRRKPIPRKVRLRVFRRDLWTCKYCNCKFPESELHVDHIIPIVMGGFENMENYATACNPCNRKKGAKKIEGMEGSGMRGLQ